MARMATRPKLVTVSSRGIPYELDLVRCRRALVARQVDGDLDSMESLARAVGISRSTASRFFSERSTSLAVTLRIIDALHLKFDEVSRPEVDPDDSEGPAAAAVGKAPPASPPGGGLTALGM
jgi:transcriptional regulator with XRE-family HTH domain